MFKFKLASVVLQQVLFRNEKNWSTLLNKVLLLFGKKFFSAPKPIPLTIMKFLTIENYFRKQESTDRPVVV